MGDKINARNLMAAAGVPVAPGTTEPAPDAATAAVAAREIGFPVMVKAAAGGGGMGMAVAARRGRASDEYEQGPRLRRADVRRRLGARGAVLPAGAPPRGADPRPG